MNPPAIQPSYEERNWAIAAHLSALVAVLGLPFGHVLGPLVVYLTQRRRSAFAVEHARASLNFQITISIAVVVLIVIAVAIFAAMAVSLPANDTAAPIGFLAMWIVAATIFVAGTVAVMVFIIAGAVAASKDQPYRYPFTIEFVR